MKKPARGPFPQWQQPSDIVDSIANPAARELTNAITSQLGFTVADPSRPEWANSAAKEFWRCLFGEHLSEEMYQCGFMYGLIHPSLSDGDVIGSTPATEFVNKSILMITNEKTPEAAEFMNGYGAGREAVKLKASLDIEEILQPAHTWRIYLVIAMTWRGCGELKTARQWRDWLISIGVLKPRSSKNKDTEESEIVSVGKLLRRIKFPLTNRGGRPKAKTPTRRKIRGFG